MAGRRSNNVVRYDPITDTLEEFVPSGNGVYRPAGLTFGSDGNLYIANSDSGNIADTEAMRNQVVQIAGPNGGTPGQLQSLFVTRNGDWNPARNRIQEQRSCISSTLVATMSFDTTPQRAFRNSSNPEAVD